MFYFIFLFVFRRIVGDSEKWAHPARMSEKATHKVVWTASTYVGEGLPWSFMHQMATEFLTAVRAPLVQVGFTSLLHLGTTFKFVWSPAVDLLGTKRGWMLATQTIMAAVMMLIALWAQAGHLGWFWSLLALLAILSATHDIACDGFYMAALDRKDQALYSGVRVAAFRSAMVLGSSGLVYLAGRRGWLYGFGAAGICMLLVAGANALLVPRPVSDRSLPPSGTSAEGSRLARFFETYRSFLAQPNAVLVLSFMFLFRVGDIMMFAMSKPLLRDIGVDTATRGLLNGLGTAVTIAAAMAGGAIISRRGLERTLVPLIFIQNMAIPLYMLLSVLKPGLWGVGAVVVGENLAAGLGTAAHTVFMMQRCRAAFSASHYALATAVVGLSSTLSGSLSGVLNGWLGHPLYFTLAFVMSWPSLVLVWYVPKRPIEST